MIKMINKKIIFSLLILLILPLAYAGNYGEGVYNSGDYNVGVPSTPTPSPSPSTGSSGGGGGGGGAPSCSYDWQCTDWFPPVCPESRIKERICVNRGDCTGTKGMPNQTQACEYIGHSEPLFDIYLTLEEDYKEICTGKKIKANIDLENYAKIELLDAFMRYWIVNENNKLIVESKDTRAVEKELNFDIELQIPKFTLEGNYRLYVEVTYDGNKTALAGESFEIVSSEGCNPFDGTNLSWFYSLYGVWVVIALLFSLILIRLFKHRFKSKKNLNK